MLCWVFFLAVLGVTMAIPMKRQMINIEQLRFPSGIAAAETLRALHSHGEKAIRSAKALGLAGVLAAVEPILGGRAEADRRTEALRSIRTYGIGKLMDRLSDLFSARPG